MVKQGTEKGFREKLENNPIYFRLLSKLGTEFKSASDKDFLMLVEKSRTALVQQLRYLYKEEYVCAQQKAEHNRVLYSVNWDKILQQFLKVLTKKIKFNDNDKKKIYAAKDKKWVDWYEQQLKEKYAYHLFTPEFVVRVSKNTELLALAKECFNHVIFFVDKELNSTLVLRDFYFTLAECVSNNYFIYENPLKLSDWTPIKVDSDLAILAKVCKYCLSDYMSIYVRNAVSRPQYARLKPLKQS